MSRQLNVRVSDAFARTLERVAKRIGRPMAAVLEAIGAPALEAAEEDARFEAEALDAWEAYQLEGEAVAGPALAALFASARSRARAAARRRSR
jgi:predicted transcriptional regulator